MVQILPRSNPSFGEQVSSGITKGFDRGIDFGYKNQLGNRELKEGLADYETIKKFAGPEVADFYKASPIGGKTKIVEALIGSLQRGDKFGDLLSGVTRPSDQEAYADVENLWGPSEQESPDEMRTKQQRINLPDYTIRPKGFTDKEWASERSGWSKDNTKKLSEAHDRLRGNKRDLLGTKKMMKLNDSHALPEGLGRFIINPSTGEPYKLAQLSGKVPTGAQEWVKEIARFGNRAKDAFGSRVTNFDLFQYMKQFPSLLNSPDGRRNILRMMEINYELDALYETSVQQIIDQKGSGNIPPAEVDRVARSMIKSREEQLFDEYLNIESQNESNFINEGSEKPSLEEIFG